jgi:hypothetical protein
MRLPRRGILIRIIVYGGLLGFFGWRALAPRVVDPARHEDEAKRLQELRQHSKTVTLPNGETQVIYEITPEQAERLFGVRPDPPAETKNTDSPEAPAETGSTGPEPLPAEESSDPAETDATSVDSGDDVPTASH